MTPAELLSKTKRRKLPPRNESAVKRDPVWSCRSREYREELNLSLRDVADAVGICVSALHQIEYGSDPQLLTAQSIADFYGCTIQACWPKRFKRLKPKVRT